jgi:hypothetical protein
VIQGHCRFPEQQKTTQHYKQDKAGMQQDDQISKIAIDHVFYNQLFLSPQKYNQAGDFCSATT